MNIYYTIGLKTGRKVLLEKGEFSRKTVFELRKIDFGPHFCLPVQTVLVDKHKGQLYNYRPIDVVLIFVSCGAKFPIS